MSKIRETVEAYEVLLERALCVCSATPYWNYLEGTACRLTLDGDTAILSWSTAETEYDVLILETRKQEFPATLLTLSDSEFTKWQAEEDAKAKALEAVRKDEARRALKQQELSQLAQLKAKYEA